MNCYTLKEKWQMAWNEVKRFFLITTIVVIGTGFFAGGLALAWSIKENKELKQQIVEMDERSGEEKSESTYIIVDGKTYKVVEQH